MKVQLIPVKKVDGSCDIFVDAYVKEQDNLYLTAEPLKFRQTELYSLNNQPVLNVSLKHLKCFAKQVLDLK